MDLGRYHSTSICKDIDCFTGYFLMPNYEYMD